MPLFSSRSPPRLFLSKGGGRRAMASQGSVEMTDSQADRELGIDNGDSQDAGGGGGESAEPAWLTAAAEDIKAKRTAGLATAAAVPSAVGAAPAPPKPVLQPSVSTAMRGMQVAAGGGAASAAATALPSGAVRTAADKLAEPAVAESESESDSNTDEEEIDTRTDEQKQQDEIANAISAEITRV